MRICIPNFWSTPTLTGLNRSSPELVSNSSLIELAQKEERGVWGSRKGGGGNKRGRKIEKKWADLFAGEGLLNFVSKTARRVLFFGCCCCCFGSGRPIDKGPCRHPPPEKVFLFLLSLSLFSRDNNRFPPYKNKNVCFILLTTLPNSSRGNAWIGGAWTASPPGSVIPRWMEMQLLQGQAMQRRLPKNSLKHVMWKNKGFFVLFWLQHLHQNNPEHFQKNTFYFNIFDILQLQQAF